MGCFSLVGRPSHLFSLVICSGHLSARSGPAASTSGTAGMLSQQMLRKYITYAKQTCRPKLQSADYDKIAQVWLVGWDQTYCAAERLCGQAVLMPAIPIPMVPSSLPSPGQTCPSFLPRNTNPCISCSALPNRRCMRSCGRRAA